MVEFVLLAIALLLPFLIVIALFGYIIYQFIQVQPWIHDEFEDYDFDKEYDEYVVTHDEAREID